MSLLSENVFQSGSVVLHGKHRELVCKNNSPFFSLEFLFFLAGRVASKLVLIFVNDSPENF